MLLHLISRQCIRLANLEKKLKYLDPLVVINVDGTKLIFDDGWLLVRTSGTEPKIRITAEAKKESRARQLYDSCIKAIQESIDDGVKAN